MTERPAFAKINLGLHVLGRRHDGFHYIETVMVRIGWADRVRVAAATGHAITFACSDTSLPSDDGNTCVRAADLLAKRFGVREGADIYLEKHVPYGSGLGSGSSDAATVLLMLRDLWNIDCSDDDLEVIAGDIGSDVPFFVSGRPALATGRGTTLQAITCEGDRGYTLPFWIAVAVPQVRISTEAAYRSLVTSAGGRVDLRTLVCTNDTEKWTEQLVNDFEAPMRARYPELDRIIEHFHRTSAAYVSLSGSGSAVYALFESRDEAHGALSGAALDSCRTWSGRAV